MLGATAPARGSARLRAVAALAERAEPCDDLRALPGARTPERFGAAAKDDSMLDIYPVTIQIARDAGRCAKLIAQHDADLARQLRRAATSIALNVAEGAGVTAGHRRQRYSTALGSAYEVRACFEVAVAMEYLRALDPDANARLDRVIGTLVKLCR